MERLRAQLDALLDRFDDADTFRGRLRQLISAYPFSEFEYIISHLLSAGKLTLDEYYDIREDYIHRNLYLYLFEISAPRGFGEVWAHGHLKAIVPVLGKPGKNLDPTYSGQYDFFLDGIRIEVKASRAVEFSNDEPLYVKALSSDSQKPFDMNFQQIKPGCCDVFVWLAAWRDTVKYWVLPSCEVETNSYFSKEQHRGNVGEGQLHLNQRNIREFDSFLVSSTEIEKSIRAAFKRESALRGRT